MTPLLPPLGLTARPRLALHCFLNSSFSPFSHHRSVPLLYPLGSIFSTHPSPGPVCHSRPLFFQDMWVNHCLCVARLLGSAHKFSLGGSLGTARKMPYDPHISYHVHFITIPTNLPSGNSQEEHEDLIN